MPSSAGPSSPAAALAEALENSARLIDRHLQDDRCFPDLSELLSVPSHSESCRDRAEEKRVVIIAGIVEIVFIVENVEISKSHCRCFTQI